MTAALSEDQVLEDIASGKPVSLERALLIVSGLATEEEIRRYQDKIGRIFDRFIERAGKANLFNAATIDRYPPRMVARELFEYLWHSKPKRFGPHFLLAEVVDAQLLAEVHQTVGTCVGLTSLYSVLGLRAGLNLSLLTNSEHLLTRLKDGDQNIDIDHTDPDGFDCRVDPESFREHRLEALVASVLNSRGLSREQAGDYAAAGADYEKALLVNPQHAAAWNNRGNMRCRSGDREGGIADYDEAIRLHPGFSEAYCNRGMAKQKLGRFDEALSDYRLALKLNPDYQDAQTCIRSLHSPPMSNVET